MENSCLAQHWSFVAANHRHCSRTENLSDSQLMVWKRWHWKVPVIFSFFFFNLLFYKCCHSKGHSSAFNIEIVHLWFCRAVRSTHTLVYFWCGINLPKLTEVASAVQMHLCLSWKYQIKLRFFLIQLYKHS